MRFLALVTTMVTKDDHGNYRSNDCGNHGSNHRGYYNGNTRFLHLWPRILPYLMAIGCEMNQILLRSLKKTSKGFEQQFASLGQQTRLKIKGKLRDSKANSQ